MKQVVVFYNPFLPELKVTVGGRRVATYSALMSSQHQRVDKWADRLFEELYREANSEYELCCVSTEFVCNWLEEMARKDPHCLGFTAQSLPMAETVYDRLEKLELLGCDPVCQPVLVPLVNASSNGEMTAAVYEVLEEQGIFGEASQEGITWSDCPLVELQLTDCKPYELPSDHPVVIVLCESQEDTVRLDTDAPVYAMVMGAETRWLKQSGGVRYFSVEPDDLSTLLLGILEEEVLCPLVSQLAYHFPEGAKDYLTQREKEELALVCQASPLCQVVLPTVYEVGRTENLSPTFFPSSSQTSLRIVSDAPEVISGEENVLYPHSAGTAVVAVYVGEDPYPVAEESVRVRQRVLIEEIKLFPSMVYLPEGGQSQAQVTVQPETAENRDEIRWHSDDETIAIVDADTGVITGLNIGRCNVTAATREASAILSVEVQPEMEDVECPGAYLELTAGEQKEWRIRPVPENAYGAEMLRILSSDKSVADYRGGYVLGIGVGDCRIYIKNQSGSISREIKVSVKKKKFW